MDMRDQVRRLLEEVEMAEVLPDRDAAFAHILRRNRSAILYLAFTLHDLGVTGGEVDEVMGASDRCDLCGAKLVGEGAYVDGQTRSGGWASMCMGCFGRHGVALGWGVGQLYRGFGCAGSDEVRWRCIAGGDPHPESGAEP